MIDRQLGCYITKLGKKEKRKNPRNLPVVCTYRLPSPVNKCAAIGPSSFPPSTKLLFPCAGGSLAGWLSLACSLALQSQLMMTPTNVPSQGVFVCQVLDELSHRHPHERERERERDRDRER